MPWIPFYANPEDARLLLNWLEQTREIGFLVDDGPKRWKAVPALNTLPQAPILLWHVPTGPLPLLTGSKANDPVEQIEWPWNGWTEKREGSEKRMPYFGPGYIGVIELSLRLNSSRTWNGTSHQGLPGASNAVGLSSFGWIGNHYSIIDSPAKPETEKFWKKLRRFVASRGVRIPRVGPLNGVNPEIYALPSVLAEIKNGRARGANPEFG